MLQEMTCDSCGKPFSTEGCCVETLQGERVRTHYFVPTRHLRIVAMVEDKDK